MCPQFNLDRRNIIIIEFAFMFELVEKHKGLSSTVWIEFS